MIHLASNGVHGGVIAASVVEAVIPRKLPLERFRKRHAAIELSANRYCYAKLTKQGSKEPGLTCDAH